MSDTTGQPKCPVCGVPLSQEVKRCSFDGCPRMTTAYNPFTSPLVDLGWTPPPVTEPEQT